MGMINKKSWKEFQETGLLLFINQILHVFGWAIVYDKDPETKEVIDVYPARVKFRGFSAESTGNSYKKISKYLVSNAEELLKEAEE